MTPSAPPPAEGNYTGTPGPYANETLLGEGGLSLGVGKNLDETVGRQISASASVSGEWEFADLIGDAGLFQLLLGLADRERRFLDGLGACRMGMAGAREILGGAAEFHQHRGFVNHLAGLATDDVTDAVLASASDRQWVKVPARDARAKGEAR